MTTKIPLTRREAEVVELLPCTYKQAARALGVSPATVRSHVVHIAARLPYHHLAAKAAVTHYAAVVFKQCGDLG